MFNLLVKLVLQTLHQLHCPFLDMLQHPNVLLVVRGAKLNTGFDAWPHQGPVQGHNTALVLLVTIFLIQARVTLARPQERDQLIFYILFSFYRSWIRLPLCNILSMPYLRFSSHSEPQQSKTDFSVLQRNSWANMPSFPLHPAS